MKMTFLGTGSYCFTNTVKSITESLSLCLRYNKIKHRMYFVEGKTDKRNGNLNKGQYNIYLLGGKKIVAELHSLVSFELKGQMV